jgi:hypothetical protein
MEVGFRGILDARTAAGWISPGVNAAAVTQLVTHRPRLLVVLGVGVASRSGGLEFVITLASAGLPVVPVLQG